jgi:hypothetical protein
MDIYGKIEASRKAGLTNAEIGEILLSQPEAEESRKAGITDVELLQHFGLSEQPSEAIPAPRKEQTYAFGIVPQEGEIPYVAQLGLRGAETVARMTASAPESAGKAIAGLYDVVTNLPNAAATVKNALGGDPNAKKDIADYLRSVRGGLIERYGSLERINKTIETDPVGMFMDIAGLVEGGAGMARVGGAAREAGRLAEQGVIGAPGTTGRLARAATQEAAPLTEAARAINVVNPLTVAGQAVAAPMRLSQPAYSFARNMMAPRYATYLAAAEGRAPELISQLQSPANMLVPGSVPTAAQAAAPLGMTRFSALGETSRAILPTEYAARAAEQNAARVASLQKISKTPRTLAGNIKRRTDTTDAMYEQAKDAGDIVDPDPLVSHIDAVIEENAGNPRLVKEFQRAKRSLMSGTDESGAPTYHTDARVVASVIDGLKGTLENKKNKYITRQLLELKGKFIEAIPGYSEAEAQFATMSRPINRMQLGKLLIDELQATMGEEAPQRAAAFVGAVKEAAPLIREATGMKYITSLKQILTPREFKSVNAIVADLQREAKAVREGRLARQAGPTAADVTAEGGAPPRFNWFNRLNSFVNKVMEKAEGKINRRMAIKIAKEMLDPQQAAQALQQALDYSAQTEKRTAALGEKAKRIQAAANKPALAGAVAAQNAFTQNRVNQNAMAR